VALREDPPPSYTSVVSPEARGEEKDVTAESSATEEEEGRPLEPGELAALRARVEAELAGLPLEGPARAAVSAAIATSLARRSREEARARGTWAGWRAEQLNPEEVGSVDSNSLKSCFSSFDWFLLIRSTRVSPPASSLLFSSSSSPLPSSLRYVIIDSFNSVLFLGSSFLLLFFFSSLLFSSLLLSSHLLPGAAGAAGGPGRVVGGPLRSSCLTGGLQRFFLLALSGGGGRLSSARADAGRGAQGPRLGVQENPRSQSPPRPPQLTDLVECCNCVVDL
jgi:hypothetical protein